MYRVASLLLLSSLLAACAESQLTILHTNDTHSHMLGMGPNLEYTPDATGDDDTLGGKARLKTLIDEIREDVKGEVVLYDAGDFMSGTLFQLLMADEAAELQVMQEMGYDAITLGNHEFDLGPQLLGEMITTADAQGVDIPILATNAVPSAEDPEDDLLEAHFDSGRIVPTLVQDLGGGLTVGLFGIIGAAAARVAPNVKPTEIGSAIDAAEAAVDELEDAEPDLIIAISHLGVTEDLELAEAVDGIDIIIGGHSHTALDEVMVVGDTTIVQAGAYSRFLGQITVERDGKNWDVTDYELHPIDDTILGDEDLTAMIDGFIDLLEEDYLGALGHSFDEPIAWIPSDIYKVSCEESPLGDFVTDAFRSSVTALDPDHPIDFAFEGQGVLRDSLVAGATGMQGFSDIFRAVPLGGYDGDKMGYAIVDFYMNGREVRTACEVTASVAPEVGCNFVIEVSSNLRCSMNMDLLPSMRATAEYWTGSEWEQIPLTTSPLYHVTTDAYVGELMALLSDLSGGALKIIPKDIDGNPFATVDEMVFDADPNTAGVQAYRLWEAVIDYTATFPDADSDGIPEIEGY
ncbi:MAG: metallophosphoesterase, partial [Deltaproteobacteria bacterium]|nr:metallophosphoesterase [Deltaproteobacteria bacterium]